MQTAVGLGIPVLALNASLAYFDAYRSERLPANLTQAQRDYFGAHTYRRLDRDGIFPYRLDEGIIFNCLFLCVHLVDNFQNNSNCHCEGAACPAKRGSD